LGWSHHVWDGDDIMPLESDNRKELSAVREKWKRQKNILAIACAHRPIPKSKEAQIRAKGLKDVVFVKLKARTLTRTKSSEGLTTESPETRHTNRSCTPPPPQNKVSPILQPEEDLWDSLHTDMVLLGMIGLEQRQKPQLKTSVKALDQAGIRFMLFDNGTHFHAKAFGDCIGL